MKKIGNYVIAIVIILVIGIAAGFFLNAHFNRDAEPELTNAMVFDKLKAVSNLTTAQLSYNGIIRFEEGDIPFINKKSFIMTYFGEIHAGIDLAEARIKVGKSTVRVELPEVQIQHIKVDSDSMEFYDQKASLFNQVENKDVVEAIKYAEEDLQANADIKALKQRSKEQTEIIIDSIMADLVGDRELVIDWE